MVTFEQVVKAVEKAGFTTVFKSLDETRFSKKEEAKFYCRANPHISLCYSRDMNRRDFVIQAWNKCQEFKESYTFSIVLNIEHITNVVTQMYTSINQSMLKYTNEI